MEKVNEDLLINYVHNNIDQVYSTNGVHYPKLCGYNAQCGYMIFGFNDRYGWNDLAISDKIIKEYKSYSYLMSLSKVKFIITNENDTE